MWVQDFCDNISHLLLVDFFLSVLSKSGSILSLMTWMGFIYLFLFFFQSVKKIFSFVISSQFDNDHHIEQGPIVIFFGEKYPFLGASMFCNPLQFSREEDEYHFFQWNFYLICWNPKISPRSVNRKIIYLAKLSFIT